MSYAHILNLYKNQDILLFKECYALEKIDGTSAHIAFKDNQIKFFSGGASHEMFVNLFDKEKLLDYFKSLGLEAVTLYGEAYGGKIQGMSAAYGKDLKFIGFDVKVGETWLAIPQAEEIIKNVGLEFVDYVKIPTTLEAIDEQRNRFSVQAIRNGCGDNKVREGVILRPLIELTKNNGERICAKHKNDNFRETSTPRAVTPEALVVLTEAEAIATEWVTVTRIAHVLDKMPGAGMEQMKDIMAAMTEDVRREAAGEIVWNERVAKAINKATATGVKKHFQDKLRTENGNG